jgi:hypothetical protein
MVYVLLLRSSVCPNPVPKKLKVIVEGEHRNFWIMRLRRLRPPREAWHFVSGDRKT